MGPKDSLDKGDQGVGTSPETKATDQLSSFSISSTDSATENANSILGTSAIVSRLLSLAPEIQLALFDQLDAVSSTCLGLTCKYFYNLHVAQHGLKVPLFRRSDHESAIPPYSALFQRNGPLVLNWIKRELEFTDPSRIKAFVMDRVYLCGCLREWMGPQYLYSLKTRRYMKRDSYDEYPEGQTNTMELSDLEGVIEWIPLGADRLISRPFMSNGLAPFPG